MKRRASLRNRKIGIMEQWNDGLRKLHPQDSTIIRVRFTPLSPRERIPSSRIPLFQ
jgi:hypothetical protein